LGSGINGIGSVDDQSGTFMHELGHNLGLDHGGFEDVQNKPNYLSVMNYMFQNVGIANHGTFGRFDYSSFQDDLDENHLSTSQGLTSKEELIDFGTAHQCSDLTYSIIWRLSCPVDWTCSRSIAGTDPCSLDGADSTFALDVNQDTKITPLKGYDDWANLVYSRLALPGGGAPVQRDTDPSRELDLSKPNLLTVLTPSNVTAVPVTGGVHISWSRIPLQRVIGYEVLRQRLGGSLDIIRRTTTNEFVDSTAAPGAKYSYSVRPIFAIQEQGEAQALKSLVDSVPNALASEATLLRQRLGRLHMESQSVQLVRGNATPAANK
jgi:hypothetical protein